MTKEDWLDGPNGEYVVGPFGPRYYKPLLTGGGGAGSIGETYEPGSMPSLQTPTPTSTPTGFLKTSEVKEKLRGAREDTTPYKTGLGSALYHVETKPVKSPSSIQDRNIEAIRGVEPAIDVEAGQRELDQIDEESFIKKRKKRNIAELTVKQENIASQLESLRNEPITPGVNAKVERALLRLRRFEAEEARLRERLGLRPGDATPRPRTPTPVRLIRQATRSPTKSLVVSPGGLGIAFTPTPTYSPTLSVATLIRSKKGRPKTKPLGFNTPRRKGTLRKGKKE